MMKTLTPDNNASTASFVSIERRDGYDNLSAKERDAMLWRQGSTSAALNRQASMLSMGSSSSMLSMDPARRRAEMRARLRKQQKTGSLESFKDFDASRLGTKAGFADEQVVAPNISSRSNLMSYRQVERDCIAEAIHDSIETPCADNTLMGGNNIRRPQSARSWCRHQCNALSEIFCQLINILLIFVPVGLAVTWYEFNAAVVFGCNFVAIIPLASLLGAATEALSMQTGQVVGGLLNATFGNAVEMIMCIQAVKAGLISVVQANLLGSILSNLLLVLGMAICASGMVRREQRFNAQGASANMTCQLVASISVCLPTVFKSVKDTSMDEVLAVSRICSMFLMAVYGLFLFFMLKTHADLFQDEDIEGDDEDEHVLSPFVSTSLLLTCTLLVAGCSEALVDSIEDVSANYGLPKAFIGTILLPIVGNAAEHATAVTCAYKGLMDLALGVAVGSSTQIALFVVPCAILFGWIFDQPMNLAFRNFEMLCLLLSVFLVSQVLQHGNTNWLHGAMLITVYLFIAVQTCYIREANES